MTDKELQEIQDRVTEGNELKYKIKSLERLLKLLPNLQNILLEFPPKRPGECPDGDEDDYEYIPEELLTDMKEFISRSFQDRLTKLNDDFSKL